MRNAERNYEDFFDAVVREVVDMSYTNEHAAKFLVEVLQAVSCNKEYIDGEES